MDAKRRAFLDQLDSELAATVRRSGWAIQYVGGSGCEEPECDCTDGGALPFAYTIGLHGMRHPELLILGVDMATAGGVLNQLGERIRGGENLVPGQPIEFEDWPHRIVPEPVPNPGQILFAANDFYSRPPDISVRALQLSYDDKDGLFPWEEGYAAPGLQPRPGTFSA